MSSSLLFYFFLPIFLLPSLSPSYQLTGLKVFLKLKLLTTSDSVKQMFDKQLCNDVAWYASCISDALKNTKRRSKLTVRDHKHVCVFTVIVTVSCHRRDMKCLLQQDQSLPQRFHFNIRGYKLGIS